MSDKNECGCGCSTALKLIFPCSGAADVGAISDQAARKLTKDGAGKMYCLAGIGGRVSGIMATTESAGTILAIDGCPQDCAKNTLENAGFKKYSHVRVTDLGMEKGKTAVTPANIAKVAAAGAEKLGC
ncbi:MAG: putative zinc-binding protein [bacterium]